MVLALVGLPEGKSRSRADEKLRMDRAEEADDEKGSGSEGSEGQSTAGTEVAWRGGTDGGE